MVTKFNNFLNENKSQQPTGELNSELELFIDDIYEDCITVIEESSDVNLITETVDKYYNSISSSYTDERISERISNTYDNLVELAKKRIFEAKYTKNGESIEVNVIERDDNLIDSIIRSFTIVYKKKKDRYVRPTKISGKTVLNDLVLFIELSNKDSVKIVHDNTNEEEELKVYINGNLKYHLDYVNKDDVIDSALKQYIKHIEADNYKIIQKINPFL